MHFDLYFNESPDFDKEDLGLSPTLPLTSFVSAGKTPNFSELPLLHL